MSPTTRRTLERTMRHRARPLTRDPRARQLPTVTSHAVSTGEYQSDPPSLSEAIRCSQPRGRSPSRDPPLDFSLHISARQLTTGHCPAVPTRASQSDQLSLPSRRPPHPSGRTIAMSTHSRRHQPPLDTGVHLRASAARRGSPGTASTFHPRSSPAPGRPRFACTIATARSPLTASARPWSPSPSPASSAASSGRR